MSQELNMYEIIVAGMVDVDLRGPYIDLEGRMMFDRRYTYEATRKYGLSPRTADLNLIGPEEVPIPDELEDVALAIIKARRPGAFDIEMRRRQAVPFVDEGPIASH